MKSEKGITLIMLIVYIIILLLIVGILNSINNMFTSNLNYITENSKYVSEFNKFNMYFIEDVKNNRNAQVIQSETQSEIIIIFDDGTKYTYSDKGIYRNKVKICNNIESCNFTLRNEEHSTEKKIITVEMTIKALNLFEAKNDYVLRYW